MAEKPIFEKRNVLVTGGAGFIGSWLCEALLKDSRVICVDSLVTGTQVNIEHLLQNPDFEFIKADICQPLDLDALPELERFKLKFQGVQEVYHLACPTSASRFEEFRQATVDACSVGQKNVLDLAEKYGATFFQASSSVVYGPRPADGHLFKESDLGAFDHLSPRACYDEGKRWCEAMCQSYAQAHGLQVRIGRLFRVFGARMALYDGQMLPDFVTNALEGKDLVVYGDENFRTSLIYVTDVIDAIVRLARTKQDPGPVNVGSDYDLRIAEVARKIVELTGSQSKIAHEAPILFMSELGLPDLTRAKDALGWIPLVSLEAGLKKSIEYTIAQKGLLRPTLQ